MSYGNDIFRSPERETQRCSPLEETHSTHSRFNLVLDKAVASDTTRVIHSGQLERTLYVRSPGELHSKLTAELSKNNIPQLEEVDECDGGVTYKVPEQAKPLSNERLFPDRVSTETYVSDRELFFSLGSLWRRIYDATHYLPDNSFLSSTGMVEFSEKGQQIFPIPPYSNWLPIKYDHDASKHFSAEVEAELQSIYPHTPIHDLREAAKSGFGGE
jgi:hypothetical protein